MPFQAKQRKRIPRPPPLQARGFHAKPDLVKDTGAPPATPCSRHGDEGPAQPISQRRKLRRAWDCGLAARSLLRRPRHLLAQLCVCPIWGLIRSPLFGRGKHLSISFPLHCGRAPALGRPAGTAPPRPLTAVLGLNYHRLGWKYTRENISLEGPWPPLRGPRVAGAGAGQPPPRPDPPHPVPRRGDLGSTGCDLISAQVPGAPTLFRWVSPVLGRPLGRVGDPSHRGGCCPVKTSWWPLFWAPRWECRALGLQECSPAPREAGEKVFPFTELGHPRCSREGRGSVLSARPQRLRPDEPVPASVLPARPGPPTVRTAPSWCPPPPTRMRASPEAAGLVPRPKAASPGGR